MKRIWFSFAFICVALCASGAPEHHLLISPDGKLSVEIVTGEKISYSLSHEGVQLLSPSDISMTLDNGATVYGRDFRAWVPYVTKKDSWERQFFNSFENHSVKFMGKEV